MKPIKRRWFTSFSHFFPRCFIFSSIFLRSYWVICMHLYLQWPGIRKTKNIMLLWKEKLPNRVRRSAVSHNDSKMMHYITWCDLWPTHWCWVSIKYWSVHSSCPLSNNRQWKEQMVSLKISISRTLVDTVILILDQETKGKAWECRHPMDKYNRSRDLYYHIRNPNDYVIWFVSLFRGAKIKSCQTDLKSTPMIVLTYLSLF